MNTENSIIITDRNLTKSEEESILEKGMMDLTEFMDNFQYLCFVLDGSGSMYSKIHETDSMSKVELEKKVILNYADKKIGNKVTGMKIGLVEFHSRANIHLRGSSDLDEIKAAVRALGDSGGSTHGSKGIRAALTLLRRGKNMVPRIIFTSDGYLHDFHEALNAAEQAKKSGVIIDTIFIGSGDESSHMVSMDLARLSAITGGVHEEITGEADFAAKFLKVAERPLLGAGPGQ